MLLNRVAIISLTALFLTTGCMTTSKTTDESQPVTNETKQEAVAPTENEMKQVSPKKEDKKADKKVTSAAEMEVSKLKKKLKLEQSKVAKLNKQLKADSGSKFQGKTVLGEEEWAYVTQAKGNFKARIDSGAATSSINAVDIERFERDGKKWVRFNLTHKKDGKAQVIEAKIVRIAKITQSSKPGVETERPVVKLHIRMGDISTHTEFSLTNRLHMEYPVLIGRTFLQDIAIVDVSASFIHPKYTAKKTK